MTLPPESFPLQLRLYKTGVATTQYTYILRKVTQGNDELQAVHLENNQRGNVLFHNSPCPSACAALQLCSKTEDVWQHYKCGIELAAYSHCCTCASEHTQKSSSRMAQISMASFSHVAVELSTSV